MTPAIALFMKRAGHWLAFVALFVAGLATLVGSGGGGSSGGAGGGGAAPRAPSITTPPASLTRAEGATATFSVVASGSATLSYQWRRNGADIAGATGDSYTTPPLTSADNGAQFTVVVSNAEGSVTSAVATLSVGASVAPGVSTQPVSVSVVVGQTASFSVVATGSDPLAYQWQRNGVSVAGATAASHTTPATNAGDDGASYTVTVSNPGGSVTSEAAVLTVTSAPVAPGIVTPPAAATVNAGQTATFSVVASGSAPLAYQWLRNGAAIVGATAAGYTTPATVAGDDGSRYSVRVSNGTAPDATSAEALLTVSTGPVYPAIVTPPSSVTVIAGQTATFSAVATGSEPLSYQWLRNGAPISGATSPAYTTPAMAATDSGARYTVRVANAAGSVTSVPASLTVGAAFDPAIVVQPASQSIVIGQTATFSVVATGTGPLAYQWRRSGGNIAGATSATFTTPVITTAGGVQYSVRITNAAGNVTSANATLTPVAAAVAPTLPNDTATASVIVGQVASFTAAPAGTGPFSYQWRRDGVAIVGATSATYSTAPSVAGDSGAVFSVVVANGAGSVTSVGTTLTVVTEWAGIKEDGAPGVERESARAVATDGAGNVIIAGDLFGEAGSPSFTFDNPSARADAWVAKYSAAGALLWAHRSLASGSFTNFDSANGVTTDAAGNIYVVGETGGVLPGQISAGNLDVTVMKYAPDGTLIWARQFGSSGNDYGRGIGVDATGNIFISGEAHAQLPEQPPASGLIFVAKLDNQGNRQWIRQFGAGFRNGSTEGARGLAMDDAGNAYVGGYIVGPYGGVAIDDADAFATKYDTNGNQVWFTRPRGLGRDAANAIAVSRDGSAVFLTGRTYSDFDVAGFPAQNRFCCTQWDVFVARLNGGGALQWATNLTSVPQINESYFYDEAFGIATDATGSAVFITGVTGGRMPGDTAKGNEDIFVARYEGSGVRTWVKQFGADIPATGARNDRGLAATVDRNGDVFVVGETTGTLGTPNPNIDRFDWFVMKLRAPSGTPY
jgi:hypothetical protein